MWKRLILMTVCVVAVSAPFSAAQSSSDTALTRAEYQLTLGKYKSAQAMAEALATAEGYALAAEALSAQIMLGHVDDPKDAAKEAFEMAERALALDPDNRKAQEQYALTFGFVTRTTGTFKAWRKKYPDRSRDMILGLLVQQPKNPRGSALLGAWHLGVIRKTGKANGQGWYGATLEEGIRHYETALDMRSDDILILSNYAVALFVLDPERYRDETRERLARVMKATPEQAIEVDVQRRMKSILKGLDSDSVQAVKLSEHFLDGDPVDAHH